ncbi:MAG TPA: DedA family protein [Spirochaetia bacterium]|nr:DedA family protein [Spirochaetia bacterium]
MAHLLRTLQPYLQHYGYFAVFFSIFLEDFGVPMPGETLLIAGALLASRGSFNIYLLLITAVCAAILGDNVGYAIGRFGGRRLVLRYGRYVLATPARLAHAERFFQSRGAVIVVAARFFEILRQLNGIIAGISGMRWWRFLAYNAAGAILWAGFWSILFFQLGRQGERVGLLFHRYEPLAVALLAVVVVGIIAGRFLFRKRQRKTEAEGRGGD